MPTTAATQTLLLECAQLLNERGPDSIEVDQFIQAHADDREFVDLARLSCDIKRALVTGSGDPNYCENPVAAAVDRIQSEDRHERAMTMNPTTRSRRNGDRR